MRPVVGVAAFTCQENSPYTGLVTEKVVEMMTNSKRFQVVDRTSNDKVRQELELQKSEAFLDSKNLVEQDIAVGAEKLVTGHIVKIPVYAIKNGDGTLRGYKASVGFEMKVVDVATGLSSDATSFYGKASKECLSPEAAVTMAMNDLQDQVYDWFKATFPVICKITRIIDDKAVLVNAGSDQGLKPGDDLTLEAIEQLDGMPYHQVLGVVKVQKICGPHFAECSVPKKIMQRLKTYFDNATPLVCTIKIKK